MAFMREAKRYICESINYYSVNQRLYSSKINWKELRPMILKRVRNRANDYPVKDMIPVAEEVIKAREILTQGISSLLRIVPVHSCKFCPEVYVGQKGHGLRTCHGFKRVGKNRAHKWIPAKLNDIIVPVETYHLVNPFQGEIINHDERFNSSRIPAILELCYQAGADFPETPSPLNEIPIESSNNEQIVSLANMTIEAWEILRQGVQKLLLVYPAKVCKFCSEVHVGPSGHKVKTCGMYESEEWKGAHMWKRAEVDDLVPQKIMWHRRPHDPEELVDEGRGFYGHAPAVVGICARAGGRVPAKYFCMMKVYGLAPYK